MEKNLENSTQEPGSPGPADIHERDSHEVDWTQRVEGTFDELGLGAGVLEGIAQLGFAGPTPVQREVMTPALEGHDLIIQSKTGSGKTAAFGIPLAERLVPKTGKVQALVLAPTRELVQQVERELSCFVKADGHKTLVVIGGVGYGPQDEALAAGASVVVGTPGRVLDQLKRGNFDASEVRITVLDEADEMLSMGFWEEVTSILDFLPKTRQTMLLSATLPPEIERAAQRYLSDPVRLELAGDISVVQGVRHVAYAPFPGIPTARNLLYVLEVEKPRSTLVFCNTKAESAGVAIYLSRFGFRVDTIHGDLSQRERERAMGHLRSGEIDILVATDIAARGIDVCDLSHVINLALPEQPESYVHRVGRTGRIGRSGVAITLMVGANNHVRTAVQKRYGVEFEPRSYPPEAEIIKMQHDRLVNQILESARDVEFEMYVPVAEAMCETPEGRRAVGYLLRQHFTEQQRPDSGGQRQPPRDNRPRRPGKRGSRPRGQKSP